MMARLGDVATYVNGFAFKPEDWSSEGLPIIRIQDLTGNSYQANRYDGRCDAKYEVNPGDILISWSASLGVYVWQNEKALLNQHIFKVIFNKVEVDKSFFVHQVRNILDNAGTQAHGATMKHLTKPVFDALPFYLPDLPTQRRIAATLDKVSEGIALCKQMLADLDELVKSQFVEMFGDPVKNPMRWPSKPAKQLMTKIGSGATPKGGNSAYIDEGISLIRSMHVYNGCFDYDDLAHINEEQAHALDGVTVENNDVLLNITGASVARCCIVPDDILPARVNQHVCILRCRQNTILPVFVNAMLISDSYQDLLWQYAESAGATRQALTKQQIENLQIILPPIELQKQYERFKNQADKSKIAVQQQLAELETLKKSLMQEYFG